MAQGLSITLNLLTETDNEAADRVLIPALDSPDAAIQEGALIALLKRRTTTGGKEILERMARMKPEWKTIIRQHRGRLTSTLRDAVLGMDPVQCENGCRAAAAFCDYDIVPTLLSALDGPARPSTELVAQTILELAQALYEELSGTQETGDRRDPQMIRRYVLGSLESGVQRFAHHRRREVVESFLLLVARDNATLRQILGNPGHAAYATIIELLGKSMLRGVVRLLLNFLDDPHAPIAALDAIAGRGDARFVHYLMRKIGREPTTVIANNLKKVTSIAWLSDCRRLMEQLDDAGQHAAVRFTMVSAVPRPHAFKLIESMLLHGKPEGRREAARALAEFQNADANILAMRTLADPDPQVQANIIAQLRGRGIPGIVPSLLEMVESSHPTVRKAAQESLAEFSFKRYLAAFDALDEEVRRTTGLLVKKIDDAATTLLCEELKSPVRTRRLRGLAIARAIDSIAELESAVIAMLKDGDHLVRSEAALALSATISVESIAALQDALSDTSETVRQAAERSLQETVHSRKHR